MPMPTDEACYSSQEMGNRRVADPNLQLPPCSVDLMEKHHTIIAIPQSQPSGNSVPRANAVLANQTLLPSFDIAHRGWDASNVSTAKCDLCHRQRCGTLQKCRVCKLSICQECCVAGRLKNDRRHAIDATAVSWDVPPNSRKRKNRVQETSDDPPATVKRQRAVTSTRRGHGHGQWAAEDSTETSISSTEDNIPAAKYAPVPEPQIKKRISGIDYDHGSPMEPRLSVAPVPHYSSNSYRQYTDAISSKYPSQDARDTISPGHRRLPLIEESRDSHGRIWAPLDNRDYPVPSNSSLMPGYLVSTTSRLSQDSASRPIIPPISFLAPEKHWRHHQPAEGLGTSLDFVGQLEDFLHHHQQPVTSEMWPQHDHVSSLGIRLADTARMKQMSSSPSMPLDRCLRNEIQNEWDSREFIATDRDAGRRYRLILAAAYFASTCLGLSPQANAAREWLREKECDLREMGYDPTKSIPLMNFLQEIGVWYLQQVQR